MNLTDLTISEAAAMLQRREISATELLRAHLDAIEHLNLMLNCFITQTAELARIQAKQADDEMRRGEYRGPLHGIPLGLKDLFNTRGVRTTGGSIILAENVPTDDAVVVEKLKGAGAVLLGKLNLHEWALGVTNMNPHFGACNNPWDTARIPGGSSGGSAVTLAARLCMAATGSDTRGSIRIPAALCGIVGLKPTYGRVSLRGVIPLSWHLDHAGPMARTVADVALLLNVIAGYDADDPYSADVPTEDYTRDLDKGIQSWRIGVLDDGYFADYDPAVGPAFRAALDTLSALGAQLESVGLPWSADAYERSRLTVSADAVAYHRQHLEQRPADFSKEMADRLRLEASFVAADYADARHQMALQRHAIGKLLSAYDVLVSPTSPSLAVRQDDAEALSRARRSLTRFTAPFNVAGVPAISVPCGFGLQDGSRLPVGLQIVGPHFGESKVLRAAAAYQNATAWHLEKPPLLDQQA